MQVFAAGIAGCDLTLPTTLMPACVCREDRGAIPALLEQLVERDFFSYFPVNLITPCMYFPSGDAGCEMATCEIRNPPSDVASRTWHRLSCPSTCPVGAARERDIPPAVIARDREEYNVNGPGQPQPQRTPASASAVPLCSTAA